MYIVYNMRSKLLAIKSKMSSWIAVVLFSVLAGLWCFAALLRGKKNHSRSRLPPGPKGLPIVGHLHLLSDLPHHDLHNLAQKYGPIMHIRLGVVPAIVVSSAEAAEFFLKTHDLVFASRPGMCAVRGLDYWENDVIFVQYGTHWRNMRKLFALQLLSGVKIESMKSMRKEHTEKFVWKIRDAAQKHDVVVDLTESVGSLIEDMTYEMVFGPKYDGDITEFRSKVHDFARLLGAFNLADYIPFIGPLDLQGIRRDVKSTIKVVDGLLENIIDQHVQRVADRTTEAGNKDFIDVMLSLTESNSEYHLDRTSMKTIIMDIIAAGNDTSSITVDWTLCELFRHPKIMKRVQSELERVVGMGRMVEESDLVKLEYLDLVVKESMRLHPVTPLLIPHESREDITISGYHIPKQSRILINAMTIGRDPKVWSTYNVDEFYPERFMDTNAEFHGNDFRFLPFGSGRRGCPGLHLGIIMVKMTIAQVLHCFNWELPHGISPNDLDIKEKFGITTPRVKPLLAIPTSRISI